MLKYNCHAELVSVMLNLFQHLQKKRHAELVSASEKTITPITKRYIYNLKIKLQINKKNLTKVNESARIYINLKIFHIQGEENYEKDYFGSCQRIGTWIGCWL